MCASRGIQQSPPRSSFRRTAPSEHRTRRDDALEAWTSAKLSHTTCRREPVGYSPRDRPSLPARAKVAWIHKTAGTGVRRVRAQQEEGVESIAKHAEPTRVL